MLNLIRPELQTFTSYSSARDEAKKGKIWLNANESPYINAVEIKTTLNRYPEKQPAQLIEKLATLYQVKQDQLVISRGSDEVIDLLVRLFCTAGRDAILTCPPTFGMYGVCAQLQNAQLLEIPLLKNRGYQLDLSGIQAAWQPNIKIIFLCSPNNPTGNLLAEQDIHFLCQQFLNKSMIVIDEAYIEYANLKSFARYIMKYENLVILRTLSKAYGLANARCGILLAQEKLVEWILKIMPPYPLSGLTITAVSETLSESGLKTIQQQVDKIKSERSRLYTTLQSISCIKKIWPSEANYLLLETFNAQKIMQACEKEGVVIRSMENKLGLKNCIRISIGLPDENTQLMQIISKVER